MYLAKVLLRAWILQDLHRTEMRGYGVGGNKKGHTVLATSRIKVMQLEAAARAGQSWTRCTKFGEEGEYIAANARYQ